MKSKDGWDIMLGILAAFFFVASIITLYYFVRFLSVDYRCGTPIDMPATGQVGDFIGGVIGTIFSFIGTLFVILTLRAQRRQMQRENFDTTFQSLIEMHRKNVEEMHITHLKRDFDGRLIFEEASGREVFPMLVDELSNIYADIIDVIYLFRKKQKRVRNIANDIPKALDVAYGFLLYTYVDYTVPDYFFNRISVGSMKDEITNQNSHPELWALRRNLVLGHYFRHLYNMVKYVDDAHFLSKKEKIEYGNIIRSQISDAEQILLYYNSLSYLGRGWRVSRGTSSWRKLSYIGKYRLIKNCPGFYSYFGVRPVSYYENEIKYWKKHNEAFLETYFSHKK